MTIAFGGGGVFAGLYAWGRKLGLLPILLLLIGAPSRAAPPPGTDANSELGRWFQGLRQPGTAYSCCSLADCRLTDYRAGKAGYEALVGDRWIPIPPDRIVHTSNPTGRAVVCAAVVPVYHQPAIIDILCFVRPEES